MSEKRFFVKVYSNNEPFFFDEKQEYVEERYTCADVRNLHPMGYWQVVDLLNELSEENEQLKKSEKINMEYAEQIVEENHKLRIAKNDLRIENERLRKSVLYWEKKLWPQ